MYELYVDTRGRAHGRRPSNTMRSATRYRESLQTRSISLQRSCVKKPWDDALEPREGGMPMPSTPGPRGGTEVIVLAGGRGSRLGALTDTTAKPMLRLEGKPLIERLLCRVARFEADRFKIVVGYCAQQIMDYLGSGERFGVRIEYSFYYDVGSSEGALIAALTNSDSRRTVSLCADDLLSAAQLQALFAVPPRGGLFLTRRVPASPLPRVRCTTDGRITAVTQDPDDPIITYNFAMDTGLLRDWAGTQVSRIPEPLVAALPPMLADYPFSALDATDALGVNTPEDWERALAQHRH